MTDVVFLRRWNDRPGMECLTSRFEKRLQEAVIRAQRNIEVFGVDSHRVAPRPRTKKKRLKKKKLQSPDPPQVVEDKAGSANQPERASAADMNNMMALYQSEMARGAELLRAVTALKEQAMSIPSCRKSRSIRENPNLCSVSSQASFTFSRMRDSKSKHRTVFPTPAPDATSASEADTVTIDGASSLGEETLAYLPSRRHIRSPVRLSSATESATENVVDITDCQTMGAKSRSLGYENCLRERDEERVAAAGGIEPSHLRPDDVAEPPTTAGRQDYHRLVVQNCHEVVDALLDDFLEDTVVMLNGLEDVSARLSLSSRRVTFHSPIAEYRSPSPASYKGTPLCDLLDGDLPTQVSTASHHHRVPPTPSGDANDGASSVVYDGTRDPGQSGVPADLKPHDRFVYSHDVLALAHPRSQPLPHDHFSYPRGLSSLPHDQPLVPAAHFRGNPPRDPHIAAGPPLTSNFEEAAHCPASPRTVVARSGLSDMLAIGPNYVRNSGGASSKDIRQSVDGLAAWARTGIADAHRKRRLLRHGWALWRTEVAKKWY